MIVAPEQAFGGPVISAELSMSPWRSDYLITTSERRVWRIVSEDSRTCIRVFPADCPHRSHFHCHIIRGE